MQLLRQEAELSSREVAEALQIIPASLRNVERDHNEPGLRVAWRISEYSELPLE